MKAELEEAALAETQAGSLASQHEQRFRLLEDEERSMADQENLSAEVLWPSYRATSCPLAPATSVIVANSMHFRRGWRWSASTDRRR